MTTWVLKIDRNNGTSSKPGEASLADLREENAKRRKELSIKRERGLLCKQRKAFKITTNSAHNLRVSPNLLEQNVTATAPNQIWTTAITSIPTWEGGLYLAAIKDLFSKAIVGYAMSNRMTTELVSDALLMAVNNQCPPPGLIHHADRGSQYGSHRYQAMLKQFGMRSSLSRKGHCYDNAPIESLGGSLKNELVHHARYETRLQAEVSIREYIEIFYNRQRRHSAIGNLSPAEFMKNDYQQAVAP